MTSSFASRTALCLILLMSSACLPYRARRTPERSQSATDGAPEADRPALAATSGSDNPDQAQERLRTNLYRLTADDLEGREDGTAGSGRAQDYLIDRLRAIGAVGLFDGSFKQVVTGTHCVNIGGVFPGSAASDEAIALVAHYDHLGERGEAIFSGAQDNAASVVIALEAAGRVRAGSLGRSLVVLFPGCEEPPEFLTPSMGSMWFATHPPESARNLRAAVVLDVMGRPPFESGPNTVFVIGSEACPWMSEIMRSQPTTRDVDAKRVSLAMIEGVPYKPWRRDPLSDYEAFRNHGIPYVFLSQGRSQWYHTPFDRPELCDLASMAATSKWLAGLVGDMLVSTPPRAACMPDLWAVDVSHDIAYLLWGISALQASQPALTTEFRVKLDRDRNRVEQIRSHWLSAGRVSHEQYRKLQMISLRIECLVWLGPDPQCGRF